MEKYNWFRGKKKQEEDEVDAKDEAKGERKGVHKENDISKSFCPAHS